MTNRNHVSRLDRTIKHEKLHRLLERERKEREKRAVTAAPPTVARHPMEVERGTYRGFTPSEGEE